MAMPMGKSNTFFIISVNVYHALLNRILAVSLFPGPAGEMQTFRHLLLCMWRDHNTSR